MQPAATAAADEASVAMLMGMGFPRGACLRALQLTGGDVAAAAALLPDIT